MPLIRFFSLLQTSFKTFENMHFVKLCKAYMLGRNMNEPVNKVSYQSLTVSNQHYFFFACNPAPALNLKKIMSPSSTT